MEFNFRLTELFPKEISIIGTDLIPVQCPGLPHLGAQTVKERVSKILDTMGRASAEAQSLYSVITNAEKLRTSQDQKLYVMCHFAENQVVGLLKIGKKKLFSFDLTGAQHEMEPMCILDFYVHESRQRNGCGKFLFENMMRDVGIPVEHFAIDRPSDKLLNFLRKHYNMNKIIPQVNNFVIFDGFFNKRSDYSGKKSRVGALDEVPERTRGESRYVLENSSDYNNEPPIHTRSGQSNIPNFIARRHDSSIGGILQPDLNGGEFMGGGKHGGHINGGENGGHYMDGHQDVGHHLQSGQGGSYHNNKKAGENGGHFMDGHQDVGHHQQSGQGGSYHNNNKDGGEFVTGQNSSYHNNMRAGQNGSHHLNGHQLPQQMTSHNRQM